MRRKYICWIGVLGVLVAFMLSGCNTHTERPPNADELYSQGKQVYTEFCAECHQEDGQGGSTLYPRLAGNPPAAGVKEMSICSPGSGQIVCRSVITCATCAFSWTQSITRPASVAADRR